jgi:hypothetical protein
MPLHQKLSNALVGLHDGGYPFNHELHEETCFRALQPTMGEEAGRLNWFGRRVTQLREAANRRP